MPFRQGNKGKTYEKKGEGVKFKSSAKSQGRGSKTRRDIPKVGQEREGKPTSVEDLTRQLNDIESAGRAARSNSGGSLGRGMKAYKRHTHYRGMESE